MSGPGSRIRTGDLRMAAAEPLRAPPLQSAALARLS